MNMNKEHAIPFACGAMSLILGVAGRGVAAGIFGLAGVILALAWEGGHDD